MQARTAFTSFMGNRRVAVPRSGVLFVFWDQHGEQTRSTIHNGGVSGRHRRRR
ncbi:MAG: hypothetical protein OJF49_004630 [Ktedonobacterales bacterium]|jgi:hypothetical protein|nr:MAG: hypothetical protein OJF49_004630 [Ktedonobacterales bacterium]